jgi:two-component system sensor histidine kinase KdpD
MATQLAKQETVKAVSSYALLLSRKDELERLIGKLNNSLAGASRDAQELRQTIAMKDEVLALVAHELRAPLTTILGNAGILLKKRNRLEPSTVEIALQDIESDAKRLQKLLTNLLVLASPEQVNQMPDEPLDFYHVVRETIDEHRKGCPHRLVCLTAEETEILIKAHGDYIEEVFINLLSNAEKYSPPEEPIEVTLRTNGNHVEASVLDRGPGIPEDEVQAIFQPFYRSPMTSNKAVGLGLGLAVCKRLIEIQGGHIWVAPREGGGSEFAFALPLSRDLPSAQDRRLTFYRGNPRRRHLL